MDMFKRTADGFEFTYDNERALEVTDKCWRLLNENADVLRAKANNDSFPDYQISTGGGNYASKVFVEGRSLFSFGLVADAATIVPSVDFDYGILPYPKWDESQEDYQQMLQRNCYAMIPTTVANADAAGAVLEALSSESYRSLVPEYCEISLKTRYSQDDDVSRMFDLLINSIVYDPGEIYASLLGTPSGLFKTAVEDESSNWASTIAASKNELVTKMESILK